MNPLQQMMPPAQQPGMPPGMGGMMMPGGDPGEMGEGGEQVAVPLLIQALQALLAGQPGMGGDIGGGMYQG
jgi:hypothetical protein